MSDTVHGELWLAKRLVQHSALPDPVGIFAGVSDPVTRKERVRQAIRRKALGSVIAARGRNGKPVTYAEAFERLYGEPIEISTSSARDAAVHPSATPGVHP